MSTEEADKVPKRSLQVESPNSSNRGVQGFLDELGPGLITGAADDDPSGISTYSVAGASFGYATLWTGALVFSVDGGYSADVRPTWHGHRVRTRERHSNSLLSMGTVACVCSRSDSQCFQYWCRSRRDGRSDRDDNWCSRILLGTVLCGTHLSSTTLDFLSGPWLGYSNG